MTSLQKIQQLSTVSADCFPTIAKQHIRSDRTMDSDPDTQLYDREITEFGQEVLLCLNCHKQLAFDEFQQVAEALNFKMIERQNNYATAIFQRKKSVFNILNCLSFTKQANITAIKIILQNGKTDSQILCKLKGLTGQRKMLKRFFTEFYKNTRCFLSQQISAKKLKFQSPIELLDTSNPFQVQNLIMFTVNRLLSNQKQQKGKFISLKISQIRMLIRENTAKQPNQLSKFKPIKMIMSLVNQTVKLLQQILNKSESKISYENLLYLRFGVQKFIFQRVNEQLTIFYRKKTAQVTRNFELKRDLIFEKCTLKQIFEQASISQKFIFLLEQERQKAQKSKFTPSELIKILQYEYPCKQIHKLFLFNSCYPRQSIKLCQQMYAKLKILISEKSNNSVQLVNMEDIIPMTILVILLCGNHDSSSNDKGNLRGDLQMMFDFINEDPCDCETQKRLVLNMIESINYIARDWKI